MYPVSKFDLIEKCAGVCAETFKSSIVFMAECMLNRNDCITDQSTNIYCDQKIWRQKTYGGCEEPVSECIPYEVDRQIAEQYGVHIFWTSTALLVGAVGYIAYDYLKNKNNEVVRFSTNNSKGSVTEASGSDQSHLSMNVR